MLNRNFVCSFSSILDLFRQHRQKKKESCFTCWHFINTTMHNMKADGESYDVWCLLVDVDGRFSMYIFCALYTFFLSPKYVVIEISAGPSRFCPISNISLTIQRCSIYRWLFTAYYKYSYTPWKTTKFKYSICNFLTNVWIVISSSSCSCSRSHTLLESKIIFKSSANFIIQNHHQQINNKP